jgi:hypothetical protein
MTEKRIYFDPECNDNKCQNSQIIVNCGKGIGLAAFSKNCFTPIKSLLFGDGIKIEDLGDEIRISKDKKYEKCVTTYDNIPVSIISIRVSNQTSILLKIKILCAEKNTGSTNIFVIQKNFQRRDDIIYEKPFCDRLEYKDDPNCQVSFSYRNNKIDVLVNGYKNKIFNWTAKTKILKTKF